MIGPSLLVAPFYEEQATRREVVLPKGRWYDFYSGHPVGDGETITVTSKALKDRIPLFVKEGAVIPLLSRPVNQVDQAVGHALEVRWYGKDLGRFDLYEDDAQSYDYERGESKMRRLRVVRVEGGGYDLEESVEGDEAISLFGPVERFRVMTE